VRRATGGALSSAIAAFVVFAFLTACGVGALALIGVALSPRRLVERAALAPLVGAAWVGIAGATLGALGARLGIVGLVVLSLATFAAGAARVVRAVPSEETPQPRPPRVHELALAAGGLAVAVTVCTLAVLDSYGKAVAEYDGWAMWGMKARALATLGSADPAVFASEAYTRLHLEYPLLLPSLNALPLELADAYGTTLVTSSMAIGVAGVLAILGVWLGRVRVAVLLPCVAATAAIPAVFLQLQTGYADVPLAMFVAAGVCAAARWLADGDGPWLALATLFLAAAVLTKNEGLLFAVAALVPLLVLAAGRRRHVLYAGLVVLLAYAPWRVYTAVHDLGAPDYDLSSSFDVDFVADRLDRAPVAAQELLEIALDRNRFGIALVFALAVVVAALALGGRRVGAFAIAFAGLALAGLTWIYVLTPYELDYFLSTNAERVVVAPLLALVALTPLLIDETARALSGEERPGAPD
jgi:hypothetical protein